jgi:hypothetical protein
VTRHDERSVERCSLVKTRPIATAGLLGALAMVPVRNARAIGPVDVEIAAKAGYASNPVAPNPPTPPPPGLVEVGHPLNPNPLRLGVGGRAGVGYLGFYGGIQMTYYFGATATETLNGGTLAPAVTGDRVSSSSHAFTYGIEAGYGLTLAPMIRIRPQIGLGNATFINSGFRNEATGQVVAAGNTSDLYLEPGIVVMFSLRVLFLGIDANLFFVPGMNDSVGHDWTTSFAVDGQVGVRF